MSRLSRNVVYNLLGQFVFVVLGLVSTRFIFRELGGEALGVIYFTWSVQAVLRQALGLGITSVTVREVALYRHTDKNYLRELLQTSATIYWIMFALASAAIIMLAPVLVDRWINLESMEPAVATRVFQVLGVGSLTAIPTSFYSSVMQGFERLGVRNLLDSITNILQHGGAVVLITSGWGLMPVVWWFTGLYGLRTVFYIISLLLLVDLRSLAPGFSLPVIRRVRRFASRMTAVTVLGALQNQADKIIMAKFLPVAVVGQYGVARSMVSKESLITGAVTNAAYPSLSAAYGRDGSSGLRGKYWRLQGLVTPAMLLVNAAMPFAALAIFPFVLDQEVARQLLAPVAILAVGYYLHSTLHLLHYAALSADAPGLTARNRFYGIIVWLPAAFALIGVFGLNGAALSWVALQLWSYIYLVPRVTRQCLQQPARGWYGHMGRALLLGIVSYGLAWLVFVHGSYTILGAILAYTIGSLLIAVVSWTTMDDAVRGMLVGNLRRLAGRGLPGPPPRERVTR